MGEGGEGGVVCFLTCTYQATEAFWTTDGCHQLIFPEQMPLRQNTETDEILLSVTLSWERNVSLVIWLQANRSQR